ncbi:cryptochrome/photolyase family protein [bacterium]|nr:cryptochrome/photolyase family protein [bacterium]MBP9809503.1 cryptochrome/photolyase family protein [bacterium]
MASIFKQQLNKVNPLKLGMFSYGEKGNTGGTGSRVSKDKRRWLYMPYDQVTDKLGPLSREKPESLGIILIENPAKAARRPYHKQKLALILANLRHFAIEQAERGVAVRHEVVTNANGLYSSVLEELAKEIGPIEVMEPAERELRIDLQPLLQSGALIQTAHEGWLTKLSDLEAIVDKNGSYRMDAFYRRVRQNTGILMEDGKPRGGKYSFDSENRLPWKGEPLPPQMPRFSVSDITEEVGQLINKHMANHPGQLDLENLPATQADCERLWRWATENCLPLFGPFEDAMSSENRGMFHSRISATLNIHRLTPKQIVQDVLSLDLPLPSQEGFIRQVLGWREFVHKIHLATDGFRTISPKSPTPTAPPPIAPQPGDGGYKLWSGKSFRQSTVEIDAGKGDGGACPSYFGSCNSLPPAFWGAASGLNCLDTVVQSVWDEAYSHHITRLMVLSNLATLLDISPRELTDWFWVAYFDAFDWVVEPNVLAMGTYSVGGLMTTKPYISGAAYINKMSDYCKGCQFDPAKNCPITRLYWAFLERHKDKLEGNLRMAMPINSAKKRADSLKEEDRAIYEKTIKTLLAGDKLQK